MPVHKTPNTNNNIQSREVGTYVSDPAVSNPKSAMASSAEAISQNAMRTGLSCSTNFEFMVEKSEAKKAADKDNTIPRAYSNDALKIMATPINTKIPKAISYHLNGSLRMIGETMETKNAEVLKTASATEILDAFMLAKKHSQCAAVSTPVIA